MATRADQTRADAQRGRGEAKRTVRGVKAVTAAMNQKRATLASGKGRAVHARTASLADAKAGKPGDGKRIARFKSGPNGGEPVTTNGVPAGDARGLDGPAGGTPSRKSTRGAWPAGEKRSAPLTTRTRDRLASPESRAARRK